MILYDLQRPQRLLRSTNMENSSKKCSVCGVDIPSDRLEVLPDTEYCVKCSGIHQKKKHYDPEIYCAKSSLSGQNGWSSKS